MKLSIFATVTLMPIVACAATPKSTYDFSGATVNLPSAVTVNGQSIAALVQGDVAADLSTAAVQSAVTNYLEGLPATAPAAGTHGVWNDGGVVLVQ